MKLIFTMSHKRNIQITFLALLIAWGNMYAQAPKWLWAKGFGGAGADNLSNSIVDPSGTGDVYTSGYFEGTVDFDPGPGTYELTSNGLYDGFISKVDSSGNLLWAKSFGGDDYDYATYIIPDGFGNVFVAGAFAGTVDFNAGGSPVELTATGIIDVVIARFDPSGDLDWAKAIGGTAGAFIQGMTVDPSGNGDFYATGRYAGTTDFDPDTSTFNLTAADWDIFTLKFDVDGKLGWAKSMGSPAFDVGNAVAVDPAGSGDVYTTGAFRGTVDFDPDTSVTNLTCTGNQCFFLSKFDANGDFVWARTLRGPNNIYGRAIAIDPASGDIYTTGVFNGKVDFDPGAAKFEITPDGYDAFVSKLDNNGDFVWARNMGGPVFDVGWSIAVDPKGSGAIYTLGHFGETGDFDPGNNEFILESKGADDVFVSKLDGAGSFLWAKSIGGELGDYGGSISVAQSGEVHVSGTFISSPLQFDSTEVINSDKSGTVSDLFIAKLDADLTSASVDLHETFFSVYPNPASNQLNFGLENEAYRKAQVRIYNNAGVTCSTIKDFDINLQRTLDISSLVPGIYFIELDLDGKKLISKLVKE